MAQSGQVDWRGNLIQRLPKKYRSAAAAAGWSAADKGGW